MGADSIPVPVQYIYPDCIHCRDSVPDKDTVRTGEVHDTHHHHGVRGGVLQLKLFHVRSDCDVPVRSPGVYPYKERVPHSAHAAFLCTCKASGIQYAQGIHYLRRQPGHFLYKTDYMRTDAYIHGIYIYTCHKSSLEEIQIGKGLMALS